MKVFRPAEHGVGVRIAGTGSYLPERVVSNAELISRGAPLSEEDILRLTGIRTRHFAADHEATSDLAAEACRRAMQKAGTTPERIDRLVLGTVSPDHQSPSAACFVQHRLGLRKVPAFDVTASCSGFLFALELAARSVLTGDEQVLAVAADVRSRWLDLNDRATCALFGDGAGAAVVSRGLPGAGLLGIGLATDGSGTHSVIVPAGGSREPASEKTVAARRHSIRMADGPQIYLSAVEGMLAVAEALLGSLGMSLGEIDLLVPHQANRRILDRLARVAGLPPEKVFVNVDRIGNVSGASCAVALDQALCQGAAGAGSKVLLVAAGAGYTAGAALITIDEDLAEASRRSGP